jgi:very-short-patch-repair endonuclease
MHARIEPSTQLRALAAAQAGVVSAGQVQTLGMPPASLRRWIRDGHAQRLAPGLYHLGVGSPTWSARAWGGVLLGGAGARLGGDAAGYVWELLDDPPEVIQVLVPLDRQLAARDCWTFPRERPGVRSRKTVGEPPRTTITDTVVDLCANWDADGVVDLLTRAVQGRRVDAAQLLACVRARRRMPNRAMVLALLGEVGRGAESTLELRYLRDVERAHGLPVGRRQHRSRSGAEVRDVLYEVYATVVELDGLTHLRRVLRDMRRDNAALVGGLATLRFGWPDVTGTPCQVAWQVAAVLVARGWSGLPTRCRRCAAATDADLLSW